MQIIQNEKYEIVLVAVEDRSASELNAELGNAIRNIAEGENRRLLMDLSALHYLSSSALRVILNAVKVINHSSGRVVLCSLNRYVKEIFESNCRTETLAIADSVESGLSALTMTGEAA
jgi:anti-anti-sigma factor